MNKEKFFFFVVLASCFFFHFSYSEEVFFIAKDGEILNESEFQNKFAEVSIRLEKEMIKNLYYDNATKLLIFVVDENNCTILHKIASKQPGLNDKFEDFKKTANSFSFLQTLEFVKMKNYKDNSILHEAANAENIDFILDFIDWWGNEIKTDFQNTLTLFESKNKDGKIFVNLLQGEGFKEQVIKKIDECIESTFYQAIQLLDSLNSR